MDPPRRAAVPRPLLVFSDLDGTLLDHHTYRWDAALPALTELRKAGAVLVLCSSKTRAEMEELQGELGIEGPLIVENGGAVVLTGRSRWERAFPDRLGDRPAKVFGAPYPVLREALGELRRAIGADLKGFGDLSVEEVARVTGLPAKRAARARAREFDEPFLWEPEPPEEEVSRVQAFLAQRGLRLTRGGRFWHLLGPNDKGRAVRWLVEAVGALEGLRPRTLGLGDAANDLPLLEAVDEGVLVERPGGGHLEGAPAGVRRVPGEGPVGWNRAVREWLERVKTGDP
ncbi:MAG: HAD-IIB family hydrolase [Candidatus Dadabacteria bacterium]|nr:MAG: HAD-IIB family hydrolase [Candidatus Dadabacteria bacterium]